MVKLNELQEGVVTKLLAATDERGKKYHFISDAEKENQSEKLVYYLWLSRFFVVLATISLVIFLASSLSLFNLSLAVTVEPFLIIRQDSSEEIVRTEPIAFDMASKNMLMETFVRQYILVRNTIIDDEKEMMVRWFPGGMLNYLSAPSVFSKFNTYRDSIWYNLFDNQISQEVEISKISKQGGKDTAIWKVDFKTYEVSGKNRNTQTGALLLQVILCV